MMGLKTTLLGSVAVFALVLLPALQTFADDAQSVQSITGSSRQSITGSSRQSITGSSRQSITGSSRQSITGSSRQSITGSSRQAANSNGDAATILIYGPVVAVGDDGVSIAGQWVTYGDLSHSLDASDVGRNALVEATAQEDGSYAASSLDISDEFAVPGASGVYFSGTVTEVDSAVGQIVVGAVTVDLNSAASTGNSDMAIGSQVTVVGTQPVLGGAIYASWLSD